MRVLLFRWLCDTGGVATAMQVLGRELQRRGIDCEYWFCYPSSRVAEFEAIGMTTIAPLGHLAPRLARREFDIVHLQNSDPCGELVAELARPARVVVTSHGALSQVWNSNTCFAYTAVSAVMAQVSQPYTDVEIEVIHNAIELDRFSPPDQRTSGPPIIAFAGRTSAPEKDFPRFIRIARHLIPRGARIWVADPHGKTWDDVLGSAADRIPIEQWRRVPYNEMPVFYRAVAASGGAVLMTSRSEGFGYTAIEAAASGAISIVPDLLGLREAVIDGCNGTLFDSTADDATVAELVWRTMASQPEPAACARAAARFAPARLIDAYLDIYTRGTQRLVSNRPAIQNIPGMDELLAHLRRQPRWRAAEEILSAASLAVRGYPVLALKALRFAWRSEPRQFVRIGLLRQILGASWSSVRRPYRSGCRQA